MTIFNRNRAKRSDIADGLFAKDVSVLVYYAHLEVVYFIVRGYFSHYTLTGNDFLKLFYPTDSGLALNVEIKPQMDLQTFQNTSNFVALLGGFGKLFACACNDIGRRTIHKFAVFKLTFARSHYVI